MAEPPVARTAALGILLVLVGFVLFIGGLIVAVAHAAAALSGLLTAIGGAARAIPRVLIAIGAIGVGTILFRKGAALRHDARRMSLPDGWTLLQQDTRPPVLYLRSFLDDEIVTQRSAPSTQGGALGDVMGAAVGLALGRAAGAHRTQEEDLVKALADLGPCIAVGDPSETLPDLGASRIYLNDEWQLHVAGLMTRSQLIVFRMGSQSPGFWWEVDRVRQTVSAERVAFWIPPQAESGEDPERVYERFAAKLTALLPCELPAWRFGAHMLRFGPEWRRAYLTPSLGEASDKAWPKDTRRRDLIIQWSVLGAIVIFAAVQMYRGTLSPTDLIKNSVLGDVGSSGSSRSARSAAFLAAAAKDANASLPKQIDSETMLVNLASAESTLIYNYRLVNSTVDEIEGQALLTFRQDITKAACANPETRQLLEQGVSLRYAYMNNADKPIGSVDVYRFSCH
jgi:hypothetical protein